MISAILIRRATARDARVVGEMRVASRTERYAIDPAAAARHLAECEAFFARALQESWLRAWLAFDGARAVGTASLTLAPTLPRLPSRRAANGGEAYLDGRVRNVYVEPSYRRRGVGRG